MPRAHRKAAFGFILANVFLEALAFGLIFPVLPRLVLELSGDTAATAARAVGVIAAAWAMANFFAAPMLGSLSDRFGRRPVILISAFGFAVDLMVMALAPSVAWLIAGRAISGLTAGSYAAMSAYIADVSEPERRAARFGVMGATFGAGMILGPAAGGLLGQLNPRAPFAVAAVLATAAWLYGAFVLPESLPPEKRDRAQVRGVNPFAPLGLLRRAPGLARLATIGTLVSVASQSINTLFVLYVAQRFGWGALQSGLLLTAFSAGNIVVLGVITPWASRRVGNRQLLTAGLVLSAVAFAGLALAPSPLWFCLACIPACLGNVLGAPLGALETLTVSETEQGRLQGALGALTALSALAGPLVFTQVYAWSILQPGPWSGLAMLMGSGLLVVATLIGLTTPRRTA